MNMLFRQFLMEWKLFSRDRGAMFWTLFFPLLMLVGFGVIFRSGGAPSLTVVWVNTAPLDAGLEAALKEGPVKLLPLDAQAAEARWRKGETPAQLERTAQGYRIRVNSYLMAQGQAAAQLIQQAHLIAQARRQGASTEMIPVAMESSGHVHATNYVAFLLPGLMGLNLVSMGLFGVGMVNVAYREKGKFRRLAVTPLPRWVFLGGQVLQRLGMVLVQASLMLLVGWLAFGVRNQGSLVALGLVIFLGTACFMAMGFALSSFAKTTETYGALSNAFFLPMMLLSGVYFTLDAAPRWLQQGAGLLPLSPFLRALRGVFNDGTPLVEHLGSLGLVAAWAVVAYLVAVKRFKWT